MGDGKPTVDLRPSDAAKKAESADRPSAFDPPARRFETVGELGRGGMGRVDDAIDHVLGRHVAIKQMLSASEVHLARFEREARITARLEHPGIVPVHDVGRSPDGTPYYVMRRVDGRPLAELIASAKTIGERLLLLGNLNAACDALGYAHAKGVVHRDIKPTNILVGPFGETLVIDWGLAREIAEVEPGKSGTIPISDPQLTRAGTVAGTPGFMSPEQARGESVDARADVFALGATLFYTLAGELPYKSDRLTDLVAHAGLGHAPRWDLIPRDVPIDLLAIMRKAMAPEREDRYPDAQALSKDLRRFLMGHLVDAYEYGAIARLVRWMRRHRAAVAVAAVSAVIFAIAAFVFVQRILAERDSANTARALAEQRERESADVADDLLVKHARELADSDPVAAIGVLRRLRASSTHWGDAWVAASAAWVQAIPFGFQGSGLAHIQIAADNRQAYALYKDATTSRLFVYDLIARTKRKVAAFDEATYASTWLDSGHIAIARVDDVVVIDVATSAMRHVPLAASTILGDRTSRLLVFGRDRRVHEIVGPNGEPGVIATGVDDIAADSDLSIYALRRGSQIEIVRGSERAQLELPAEDVRFPPLMSVRGALVSLQGELEVRAWSFDAGKLREIGRWPIERGTIVDVGDAEIYALTPDAMSSLYPTKRAIARGPLQVTALSRRSFVVPRADGGMHVRTARGWLRLGRRQVSYVHSELSRDERFVIATTTTGDLLAWDLHDQQPRVVHLHGNEQLVHISDRYAWTLENGVALHRREIATDTDEVVLPLDAATYEAEVDNRERYAVAFDTHRNQIEVFDATRRQRGTMSMSVVAIGLESAGLLYAEADGTIRRWRPGDAKPMTIAKVDGEPTAVCGAEHYVFVVTDKVAQRIDLATKAVERITLDKAVDAVGLAPSGSAWLIVDHALWQWPRGAPAAKPIALPEPVMGLTIIGESLIVSTVRAIIELVPGRPPRFVSTSARIARNIEPGLTVTMSPQGEVVVIDRASTMSFALPIVASQVTGLVANDNLIAFDHGIDAEDRWLVGVWRLGVPREPAALRRWLQDVTNAQSLPNSDAFAWP